MLNSASGILMVTAALPRELAPLRRAGRRGLVLVQIGEGIEDAERSLRRALEAERPGALISIGLAGSLTRALTIGDVVAADRVSGCDDAKPSIELLAAARFLSPPGFRIRVGTAVTVGEVICSADRKRALAASLAPGELAFIDMESRAVTRVCGEKGVPFLILRSISDGLDEDLPIDFNQCRGKDGRTSFAKVLSAAALKPRALAGLWELRRRANLCAERLAMVVQQLAKKP